MPAWLNPVIEIVVAVLLAVIAQAVKTPSDAQRASLLVALADDAAALAVNLMPHATWAELLAAVTQRLHAKPSLPTQNAQTIESVAAAALVRLGKRGAAS